MRALTIILLILAFILIGGIAFLMFSPMEAPQTSVEKTLPNDRFLK